jgi:hydrogenase maturation protein HypF
MLRILERRVNSPVTSSAGRLFDALASLLGLLQKSEFEGQAAMRLEFAIPESPELIGAYDFGLGRSTSVDWEPMIRSVLGDIHAGIAPKIVSTRVHNTFVDMIVAVARRECLIDVVLSGGCFQNRYLLEQTVRALRSSGHRVFWNQQIPINDGGVAVGQVIATCA